MIKYFIVGLCLTLATIDAQAQRKFRNTYVGVHVTLFADMILSPQSTETLSGGGPGFINDQYVPAGGSIGAQTFTINTISLGGEIRQNLVEIDDHTALGLALPLTLGYGETRSNPFAEQMVYTKGYGSLQLPLLLAFYKNLGAMYGANQDYGFSCGVGSQYTKVGLVLDKSNPEDRVVGQTSFFTPVVTLFHTCGYSGFPFLDERLC